MFGIFIKLHLFFLYIVFKQKVGINPRSNHITLFFPL